MMGDDPQVAAALRASRWVQRNDDPDRIIRLAWQRRHAYYFRGEQPPCVCWACVMDRRKA